MATQTHANKFFQSTDERRPTIGAHLQKDCMDALDELLVRLLASRAAFSGKLYKDLPSVFAAASTFYQSPLLQAVNGANHRCGVNTQMGSHTTNSAGLSGGLRVADQSKDNELRHTKAILVGMLESRSENSTEVHEYRSELLYLLVDSWLIRFANSAIWH
jgi:hypothetical protein